MKRVEAGAISSFMNFLKGLGRRLGGMFDKLLEAGIDVKITSEKQIAKGVYEYKLTIEGKDAALKVAPSPDMAGYVDMEFNVLGKKQLYENIPEKEVEVKLKEELGKTFNIDVSKVKQCTQFSVKLQKITSAEEIIYEISDIHASSDISEDEVVDIVDESLEDIEFCKDIQTEPKEFNYKAYDDEIIVE